jgi:hypothetical protein
MNCGLQISGTAPGNRRPPSAELSDCGLNEELRRDRPAWAGIPRRRGRLYKQTQFEVFRSNEGRPCEQTNPISGSRTDTRRPNCAKQTQFGQEPFRGQVLCRQGVAMHRAQGEPPQNKANFPKRGTEAVSRLRIGDGAASGRLPAPCCRWPAWAGCTNKPNLPAGAEIESLTLVGRPDTMRRPCRPRDGLRLEHDGYLRW